LFAAGAGPELSELFGQILHEVPAYEWSRDSWNIVFDPMPKGEEARVNQSVRPIGLTMPVRARQITFDELARL
jgi:hypothetical protein